MKLLSLFLSLLLCTPAYSQFEEAQLISPELETPKHAQAADLDGDGDLDIVATGYRANLLVWFENLGDAQFSDMLILSEEEWATGIDCDDIDEDGDIDIALVHGDGNGEVVWFENAGDASFTRHALDQTYQWPKLVFLADVNGDDDLDILEFGATMNRIAYHLGDGTGNFGPSIQVADASDVSGFDMAHSDLLGNGFQDLITIGPPNGNVGWMENDGLGNFGEINIVSILENDVEAVFAADLDGDLDQDILARSLEYDHFFWYENLGEGNFSEAHFIAEDIEEVNTSHAIASAADLDGDGDLEAITVINNKITYFINEGSGQFDDGNILSEKVWGTFSVFPIDINGDETIDLLSASDDDKISWQANDGTAEFNSHDILTLQTGPPEELRFADIDLDGDLDGVVGRYSDRSIAWMEIENEVFIESHIIYETNWYTSDLKLADFDSDGDTDILSSYRQTNSIVLSVNDGNGEYNEHIEVSTFASSVDQIQCADLNNDGLLDVIFTGAEDELEWFENLNGSFSSAQFLSSHGDQIGKISVSDFDTDGDTDILYSVQDENTVHWMENNGGNSFTQHILSNALTEPLEATAADLDGDGNDDVIVHHEESVISMFRNYGDGEFGPAITLSEYAYFLRYMITCDLNNDENEDLVLALNWPYSKYVFMLNDGQANFGYHEVVSDVLNYPDEMESGDFDGDGDIDLFSRQWTPHHVFWYENVMLEGCLDPEACNYDPEVLNDDGSCCYGICGCDEWGAVNYNPEATCNDLSCIHKINGAVFFDENEDGIWDEEEQGLPGQEVFVDPLGYYYLSNADGEFSVSSPGPDEFVATLLPSEEFPFITTENPVEFEIVIGEVTDDVIFGVSNEAPIYEIDVHIAMLEGDGYPCDELVSHRIFYENEGNVTLDGILAVTPDILFQDYATSYPLDSLVDGTFYFTYTDLEPQEMRWINLYLLTPDVDWIGTFLATSAEAIGFYEGEEVAFGQDDLNVEVTCAYDPNDKHADPLGYTEEHYILGDEGLEYRIRFQNTGNAPATDVVLRDTLDPNIDLNSFELLAYSHNVNVSIDLQSRELLFEFLNIMLPDSVNDEENSHGMVLFSVELLADRIHETEINNTAHIFFDNNPAIVTNTTWHKIYDCDFYESNFFIGDVHIIADDAEAYQWYLDGFPIEGATEQTYFPLESGNYAVSTINGLGCTALSQTQFVIGIGVAVFESLENQLKLYPNPTGGLLNIELKNPEQTDLRIFDSVGRLVYSKKSINQSHIQLDLNDWSPGTYLLEAISNSGELMRSSFVIK